MVQTDRKRAYDRGRMQRKRALDAQKVACLDALLAAKSVCAEYGDGFSVHFRFLPEDDDDVVKMVQAFRHTWVVLG